MSALSKLSDAVRTLKPHVDRLRIVGPALPATIDESERLVGIEFPPSYRAFAEQLGAGSILGREVYGIVPDPEASGPPNAVWATLNARRTLALPPRFLILVDLDDSSALALDSHGRKPDGELPVVRIWPGEEGDDLIEGEIAPDFGSFFEAFVRERLEAA